MAVKKAAKKKETKEIKLGKAADVINTPTCHLTLHGHEIDIRPRISAAEALVSIRAGLDAYVKERDEPTMFEGEPIYCYAYVMSYSSFIKSVLLSCAAPQSKDVIDGFTCDDCFSTETVSALTKTIDGFAYWEELFIQGLKDIKYLDTIRSQNTKLVHDLLVAVRAQTAENNDTAEEVEKLLTELSELKGSDLFKLFVNKPNKAEEDKAEIPEDKK